jgi:uncharacterized protein YjcR
LEYEGDKMANGWGGRRPGAGAPKGNNNRVRHGEYSQIPAELLAMPNMIAMICCARHVSFFRGVPIDMASAEYREWFRASGIMNQLTDKFVRQAVQASKARIDAAMSAHADAVKEWNAALARFNEASANRNRS